MLAPCVVTAPADGDIPMRRIALTMVLSLTLLPTAAFSSSNSPPDRCWLDAVAQHLLASGQWVYSSTVLCIQGYTALHKVSPND